MLRRLVLFLLASVILGCGATLSNDPTLTPFPTLTPTVTPTPTPLPTPTPQAHLEDCAAIREAGAYSNSDEYRWFRDNCLVAPLAWIGFNELPGVGARLMEIYTIDVAICPSGFVTTTVEHHPGAEAFSYLFRHFCFNTAQANLSQAPQPFQCPAGEEPQSADVQLDYLTGFFVVQREVLCRPVAALLP